MKNVLVVLMLLLVVPSAAFAEDAVEEVAVAKEGEDSHRCSVGLALGQISIDAYRFKISPVERRLGQVPWLAVSRDIRSRATAQQVSIGCMVTERVGIDLMYMTGIDDFTVGNVVTAPQAAAFLAANNIPLGASINVERRLHVTPAYGAMLHYTLPVTSSFRLRLGGGAYDMRLTETSQAVLHYHAGKYAGQYVVQGPTESRRAYVPIVTLNAELNVTKDVSVFGQVHAPWKGVHAYFIGLRYKI